MTLTGHSRSTRRRTIFSATLSTTNPTLADLGLKPGLRCERPEPGTSLRHGVAITVCLHSFRDCMGLVRRLYHRRHHHQ